MHDVIATLRGGLIVSCQAEPGDPLWGVDHMVALARAAAVGGAVAIRTNYPQHVSAIRQAVPLPVIGIYKKHYPNSPVYITPTMAEVCAIAEAGADIVAVELTDQPRPDGLSNAEFIAQIRRACPGLRVMADISTLAEGQAAAALGVDLVSTTLSGYTPYSRQMDGPDLQLIGELARSVSVPVVAEGRFWDPRDCARALELGAHAVVVGTAITRPQTVTAWYVQAMRAAARPTL
ncbi:N-acylglucosamine-6-phosphate 2-epimerase [Symbiobacterium terraclitae]|uniref:Putative N-acetylmannosamine-6-phosphate 2-epimerase n=1 Tax=Symbiobacterium terraclitae TaxID=557451 RepID=A0ABS4JVR2_9FIRM|nr:N-acetylmannosamine-6-phosphate 2-epimerase [Symbiobacterium terraclitae]MBP2019616.1 N-acylglucosamine-6-phosphate 2-epimerase [Symbiobacterium terraclitae]